MMNNSYLAAQNGSPCDLSPFTTISVPPAFQVDGVGKNVDTIDLWEAPNPANTLMFVTSKGESLMEVWQYPFTDNELAPVVHETFENSQVNGVIVDQETDLAYVAVAAPSNTVSVFSLPELTFVRNFNKPGVDLRGEPNLALLKLPNGDKRVYVSSETTVYIHDAATGAYLGEFVPEKGLETMAADHFYQAIYIPDENGRSGVYAYDPDGQKFEKGGSNVFGGDNVFQADAEGIWIYACPSSGNGDNGSGLIIVSDQRKPTTDFEVFDRLTWNYLGTIQMDGVGNTDGIVSFQKPLPDYPNGIFAAINDDAETAGVGWDTIFDALDVAVGIDNNTANIDQIQLRANYPNPFNPSTTIGYSLSKRSPVKLSVFNNLGQQVKTLINSVQAAGEYEAVWDGLNELGGEMSSGIYLYRLETPEFSEARKMLLLR